MRRKRVNELENQIKMQEDVNRDIQEMNLHYIDCADFARGEDPELNKVTTQVLDIRLESPRRIPGAVLDAHGNCLSPDGTTFSSNADTGGVHSTNRLFSTIHGVSGGPIQQSREKMTPIDRILQQKNSTKRHAILTRGPTNAPQGPGKQSDASNGGSTFPHHTLVGAADILVGQGTTSGSPAISVNRSKASFPDAPMFTRTGDVQSSGNGLPKPIPKTRSNTR